MADSKHVMSSMAVPKVDHPLPTKFSPSKLSKLTPSKLRYRDIPETQSSILTDSETESQVKPPPLRRQRCQENLDSATTDSLSDSDSEGKTHSESKTPDSMDGFDPMDGVWGQNPPIRMAEIFSGKGVLTEEFERRGFQAQPIDWCVGGILHDFSNNEMVQNMKTRFEAYQYVHFAPPCNTFSNARFPKLR